MKKIIYLHIGPHKTGTTTIQKGLLINENVLDDKGVLVPKAGRSMTLTAGHHNLAWELLGNQLFDPSYGTWDNLINEIENSINTNKFILSAEDFCGLSNDTIEIIREKTKRYTVKVIIYLRRQDQALQSTWVSRVRNRFVKPKIGSFYEWLEKKEYQSKNTNYYSLIKRWEKVFLKESIILVPFSQNFIKQNLFGHFLSLCGLSNDDITTPPNLNMTPGVKTIEAMRMIKNSIKFSDINPDTWSLIASSIMDFGDEKGWNQFKLNYLDKKLSRKIMKHHEKSNHKIEVEYFNSKSVFDKKLSKQNNSDKFTYDKFIKSEVLILFSFILLYLDQKFLPKRNL